MSPSKNDIDPRVLGQLLAAQSTLSVFSAREKMGEFVCRAVEGVPGVASAAVCLPGAEHPHLGGEPVPECADCDVLKGDIGHDPSHPCRLSSRAGIQIFPLKTQDRHFGFLLLKLKERERYTPYEPFVGNLANSLAVNIERRWQRDRLETVNAELRRHREHLEKLVQERTVDLQFGLKREHHLNTVLRAIRNVNQLIVREKDQDRLLQQACGILTETRGFRCVWVVRLSGDGRVEATAEAGIGAGFADLRTQLERGELPECCRRALASEGPVVLADPTANCSVCPLARAYRDTAAVATSLRHEGRTYGVLIVSLHAEMAEDAEEISLFAEVAGDLAFALHDIELDQRRKQAEESLQEKQALLTQAEEMGKVGGWEFDVETGQQTWTKTVYDIHELDITCQPTVSQGVNFYTPASRPIIEQAVQRAIEQGEPFDVELEIITAKGNLRSVHAIGKADLARRKISGFFQDITERKQAEDERKNLLEQLVRSEKLAAVGELISGVAHEINNPLTGILGLSELLLRENKENLNEDTKKDLKSIYESSERIKKIVANLLRFARFEAPVRKDASINELLDTVLNIRAYEMKSKNVELKKNYQPDLPLVMVDPSQLEQVFLNLITNAEYAIHANGKAGTLTITTSLQEKQPEGQKVVIEISDTGAGVPENVITKIFNPFFTTKPAGKGTGLGLSVSYGIIKEHGGEIHVRNQAEGGAVFTIELPVRGG